MAFMGKENDFPYGDFTKILLWSSNTCDATSHLPPSPLEPHSTPSACWFIFLHPPLQDEALLGAVGAVVDDAGVAVVDIVVSKRVI